MRYVVGFTNTPAGHDALALGERLARQTGAGLDVVLVIPDIPSSLVPPQATYGQFIDETAAGWLKDAVGTIDPAVSHHAVLTRSDSATQALLDAVADEDASMLVVGTARHGLGRLALGAVSDALLHSATVPVATAPEGSQVSMRQVPLSRLTCFLGTRPGGPHLVDVAIDLARRTGARLRIVSLVTVDRPGGAGAGETVIEEAAARAGAALPAGFVTTTTGHGQNIEDAVRATVWDPAEIALIGSSRLAQPRRLFIGSTATKVARVLPVPLLVVPSAPAPTKDNDVPDGVTT